MKNKNTNSNKTIGGRSQWDLLWFNFKKNKLAIVGLMILIFMIVFIMAVPFFIPYESVYKQNISEKFQSPNMTHLFGTDQLGRDLFARVMYGGRISLFAGLVTVLIAFIGGCILGGVAGYFGGRVDNVIMRINDMFMAIPALLMSMAVVVALGPGVVNMVIALSIAQVPRFARVVRSSTMTLRNQEFVEAAKCCGTSSSRIIFKHILPNGMGPIIVSATLTLGQIVISIASLGFMGIGIESPTPEWGTILSENRADIRFYPYLGLIPGFFIAVSVMAVNFIGDGLRDALDPKTKK